MKRLLLLALLAIALPAHAKKIKLYDGPERDKSGLAEYSLWNFPGFFGKWQIYTIQFDERNFEMADSGSNVPALGGIARIAPGRHRVRISFVDTRKGLFPGIADARTFPGWYDLEFEAEAGKVYAPIFDMSATKASLTDRMCIGSSRKSGGPGLAEIRLPGHRYLACAEPTLDPKTDRRTWCRSWDGQAVKSILCKHEEPAAAPQEPAPAQDATTPAKSTPPS
jgi:hypothetical protein